ncbi:hypothetical protein KY289_023389 [Solanum tuberosum]|nr:hypothetical protein KY289_023389 [Solanum tuberosum]
MATNLKLAMMMNLKLVMMMNLKLPMAMNPKLPSLERNHDFCVITMKPNLVMEKLVMSMNLKLSRKRRKPRVAAYYMLSGPFDILLVKR